MDKSWIYEADRFSSTYTRGVDLFLEFARANAIYFEDKILCPCNVCRNTKTKSLIEVKADLHLKGFYRYYKEWIHHGEAKLTSSFVFSSNSNNSGPSQSRESNDDIEAIDDLVDLIHEIGDAELPEHSNEDSTGNFSSLLCNVRRELYPGCKKYSLLAFIVKLLHIKVMNKMSDKSVNMLLELLKDVMPEGNLIPKSVYWARKLLSGIGLGYKKIDACRHDCALFWKENEKKDVCPVCEIGVDTCMDVIDNIQDPVGQLVENRSTDVKIGTKMLEESPASAHVYCEVEGTKIEERGGTSANSQSFTYEKSGLVFKGNPDNDMDVDRKEVKFDEDKGPHGESTLPVTLIDVSSLPVLIDSDTMTSPSTYCKSVSKASVSIVDLTEVRMSEVHVSVDKVSSLASMDPCRVMSGPVSMSTKKVQDLPPTVQDAAGELSSRVSANKSVEEELVINSMHTTDSTNAYITPTVASLPIGVMNPAASFLPTIDHCLSQLGVSIFPQRPGEIECDYYMKTGQCKFGERCRYHHPIDRSAPATAIPKTAQENIKLTLAGLPRREGSVACPFYMKTGTCKYGVACRFDHPPPGEAIAMASAGNTAYGEELENKK